MDRKGIISLGLALSFGLLLICKTSMELCPVFTAKVPSCHEHSQKSSKNCECPLSFTELKLEDTKFLLQLSPSDTYTLFTLTVEFSSFTNIIHSYHQLSMGYSPPMHFVDTIRLTP